MKYAAKEIIAAKEKLKNFDELKLKALLNPLSRIIELVIRINILS